MEQTIINALKKLHPDVDYTTEVRLVDDGILDSMDIVLLVTALNTAFGITIPAVDILPDNFNSVEALVALVERLDDV
ncbi:MAG: acyl carrier protein [Clostridia bacterium]|nr:acyl carrier protein [Clostridia bacterium]